MVGLPARPAAAIGLLVVVDPGVTVASYMAVEFNVVYGPEIT